MLYLVRESFLFCSLLMKSIPVCLLWRDYWFYYDDLLDNESYWITSITTLMVLKNSPSYSDKHHKTNWLNRPAFIRLQSLFFHALDGITIASCCMGSSRSCVKGYIFNPGTLSVFLASAYAAILNSELYFFFWIRWALVGQRNTFVPQDKSSFSWYLRFSWSSIEEETTWTWSSSWRNTVLLASKVQDYECTISPNKHKYWLESSFGAILNILPK